jgi:hypothetical protein
MDRHAARSTGSEAKIAYLIPDSPPPSLFYEAPHRRKMFLPGVIFKGLRVACHSRHAHRHGLGIGGFIFSAFALKESQYQ